MISQVNFTDQGMYRCVASNPAGSATAAASLTVKGKSKYRIFFPNLPDMIIRLYRAQPFSLVRLFTLFFILFSLFGELYCYFALCALAGPGDEGSTHLINRWPGPSGFFFLSF